MWGVMLFLLLLGIGGIWGIWMRETTKNPDIPKLGVYTKRVLVMAVLYTILCSLTGMIFLTMNSEDGAGYMFLSWFCGLMLGWGIVDIIKIIVCKQKISATCVKRGHVSGARGSRVYFAEFNYTVNHQQYTTRSNEVYWSEKKLYRKYDLGSSYELWIAPNCPEWLLAKRRLYLKSIFLIVVGLIAIIDPLLMYFNY